MCLLLALKASVCERGEPSGRGADENELHRPECLLPFHSGSWYPRHLGRDSDPSILSSTAVFPLFPLPWINCNHLTRHMLACLRIRECFGTQLNGINLDQLKTIKSSVENMSSSFISPSYFQLFSPHNHKIIKKIGGWSETSTVSLVTSCLFFQNVV